MCMQITINHQLIASTDEKHMLVFKQFYIYHNHLGANASKYRYSFNKSVDSIYWAVPELSPQPVEIVSINDTIQFTVDNLGFHASLYPNVINIPIVIRTSDIQMVSHSHIIIKTFGICSKRKLSKMFDKSVINGFSHTKLSRLEEAITAIKRGLKCA